MMATHINGHRYNSAGVCLDCKALKSAPKPSKLDDCLDRFEWQIINAKPSEVLTKYRVEARTNFLALFEEVIGSDETAYGSTNVDIVARNQLRAEMRLRKDAL